MEKSDPINVVLVCDDRYVRHAAVTMLSAMQNSKHRFCFYIFDCGIKQANLEKLASWDIGPNALKIIPMDKVEVFEKFPLRNEFSPAIFYRLCIPEILKDISKAIYLDSDIVVVGDLGELWELPLQDKCFGAVSEEGHFKPAYTFSRRKQHLGMKPADCYFNSGVLLFDLEALRSCGFTKQLIDFLNTTKNPRVTLPDQDALNIVVNRSQFLQLPDKFNYKLDLGSNEGKNVPCNIHYFLKVWKYPESFVKHIITKKLPYAYEYFHYAKQTLWSKEVNMEASWMRAFKLIFKNIFKPMEQWLRFQKNNPSINLVT